MTPRDWAELSRADERAGHREMKYTGSSVEPVPQSLQGGQAVESGDLCFQPVATY